LITKAAAASTCNLKVIIELVTTGPHSSSSSFPICSVSHKLESDTPFLKSFQGSGFFKGVCRTSKNAWKGAMSKRGKSQYHSSTQHAAETLHKQYSHAVASDEFSKQ